MGNNNACRRCLRGDGDTRDGLGNALAGDLGSRLVVASEEEPLDSSAAATPGDSELAAANGSNSGRGGAGGGASTESESLMGGGAGSVDRVRVLSHAAFPFTTEEASMAWLRANRVLFLMRGLPGSGKSTLVRLLRQLYPSSVVCSADHFFIDPATGVYSFQPDRLKQAHTQCNNRAYDAMSTGKSPVIVDNTNVRRWEFQFYTDLAVRFGYVLLVVLPKTPWRFDAQGLANRTEHSVPLEIIEQRLSSWEAAHPTFYAWFVDAADAVRLLRLARDFLACLTSGAAADAAGSGVPSPVPELPAEGKKLLHATARFCGRRGASQDELAAQVDYHKRADVQASLGRVFVSAVSALFVTPRAIGFKVDLTEEQLALWDNDDPAQGSLPRGCRAHLTLATAAGVPAARAGLDLLDILRELAQQPEPGPDDLMLMTEWGFARGCGPEACLLTLDQPVALNTMFASSY